MLPIAAAGVVIASVVFLLLPFQNGTDRITVSCGNSFSAITAVGNKESLEIVEGFESLEGASAAQVSAELSNAADACQDTARTRMAAVMVLIFATAGLVIAGRGKRVALSDEQRQRAERSRMLTIAATTVLILAIAWVVSLQLDWPD